MPVFRTVGWWAIGNGAMWLGDLVSGLGGPWCPVAAFVSGLAFISLLVISISEAFLCVFVLLTFVVLSLWVI